MERHGILKEEEKSSSSRSSGSCKATLGKKCKHLVKKQRAKFYIVRRCIAMLLCWHERDSPDP
ncbi:Small polypeptide DEVIL 16 [Linum grandiflorum]